MKIIASTAIILFASVAYCQFSSSPTGPLSPENNDPKLFWVDFGAGLVGPGIGLDLKFVYSWGSSSLSAKGVAAAAYSPGGGGPGGTINEVGLYYGRQNFNRSTLARFAAGISYFKGDYDYAKKINTFGMGAEGEIMLKSSPIGISLMATVMLMPKFIYAGILVNINGGKLQ
jgi:hypothetical protein